MIQDNRRAIRTGVHTVGAIWALGLLTYIVMVTPPAKLVLIALGLILLLVLREVFHGVENSVARFKFSAGRDGVSGEAER
jgi:hypothetical protein